MNRTEELQKLRERARALEHRLVSLNKRMEQIQNRRPGPCRYRAVVDFEQCIACGKCEKICPQGAITVNETANVNPQLCIGCGLCVDKCPQGALSLVLTQNAESTTRPFRTMRRLRRAI